MFLIVLVSSVPPVSHLVSQTLRCVAVDIFPFSQLFGQLRCAKHLIFISIDQLVHSTCLRQVEIEHTDGPISHVPARVRTIDMALHRPVQLAAVSCNKISVVKTIPQHLDLWEVSRITDWLTLTHCTRWLVIQGLGHVWL